MHFHHLLPWALPALVLATDCTPPSILPHISLPPGLVLLPSTITVSIVSNYSLPATATSPGHPSLTFCNITLSYTRTNRPSVPITLRFFLPTTPFFKSRFLATGGGGLSLTSGERSLYPGLVHGAATGTTDGGFRNLADVILHSEGRMDYDMLYSYAFNGIRELGRIGKALTLGFYGTEKVWMYFQGCSEGGREGLSMAQRFGREWDGVAAGAPAMRQAMLQVVHLFPLLVEQKHHYEGGPCELEEVDRGVIEGCDGADGRVDGVVSRSELCGSEIKGVVGRGFKCPARAGGPAVEGRVGELAVTVAEEILAGLKDGKGRRVYIPVRPGSGFADAAMTWNVTTSKWGAVAGGLGLQYVNLFLKEVQDRTLDLEGVTGDTLREWMLEGMKKFADTLQTNWPDLSEYRDHGGKVLHWHGEADGGISAGSSVVYLDAVRRTMYPGLGLREGFAKMDEWYRFFLIPGAGHCGPNPQQPNGPFPQDLFGTLIDWVEKGINPGRLNTTVLGGPLKGTQQELCGWPLRPLWKDGVLDCVYDQPAVESWLPELDSIPVPVY
ncbi:hypothetical protein OQA88_7445 [Cercophora sp. LCS_1]